MKTLPADLEALMPEPAAWTLNEELERRETICDAHMWFVNPQNSSWAPLFTADQVREAIRGATERAATICEQRAVDAPFMEGHLSAMECATAIRGASGQEGGGAI